MAETNRFTLNRHHALLWLEDVAAKDVVFTLYIGPSEVKTGVEKTLAQALDRGEMLSTLAEKAAGSPTGAAILYLMGKGFVIRPPFPLTGGALCRGFEPGPLRSMLEKDQMLGLVLVRLGRYAVGVFKGNKLLAGKAGTGLVHARHHKGGSSANRFARHREKQMEYFFTRIEGHSKEILGPHVGDIDYVLYGGTRDTLLKMWKQCAFFESLQSKRVDRLITLREPRRSTFEDALEQAYMSTVYDVIE